MEEEGHSWIGGRRKDPGPETWSRPEAAVDRSHSKGDATGGAPQESQGRSRAVCQAVVSQS